MSTHDTERPVIGSVSIARNVAPAARRRRINGGVADHAGSMGAKSHGADEGERHERLIDPAAEFFEQEQRAEQIRAEARERADAILEKAEQDAEAAAKEAGEGTADARHQGNRAAVAARLGLSTAELKRALDDAGTSSLSEEGRTEPTLAATADEVAEQVTAETKAAQPAGGRREGFDHRLHLLARKAET